MGGFSEKLSEGVNARLLGLTVEWMQREQIYLIEYLEPERLAVLNIFIGGYFFDVVKDAPDQVHNLVLLILVVVEDSDRVDDGDNLITRFNLEKWLFYDHFLNFIDLLKMDFVLFLLG